MIKMRRRGVNVTVRRLHRWFVFVVLTWLLSDCATGPRQAKEDAGVQQGQSPGLPVAHLPDVPSKWTACRRLCARLATRTSSNIHS